VELVAAVLRQDRPRLDLEAEQILPGSEGPANVVAIRGPEVESVDDFIAELESGGRGRSGEEVILAQRRSDVLGDDAIRVRRSVDDVLVAREVRLRDLFARPDCPHRPL